MSNFLNIFAAESGGPTVHIAPGGVFEFAGLTITNSMLYGAICALLISVFLVWVSRKATVKPRGGVVQFVEIGVDFITNLVEGAFDDKKIARKYTPYFVTLFFFIMLNNWLGLMPYVGEGFTSGDNPLFRPFTADLSATLAIGVFTMVTVYIASIVESGGLFKYLGHFFVGDIKNPIYLVSGLLEMLTDLTRVLSLSLRLFLNVTIGEIVIAVFAHLGGMFGWATALPFFMLEILVGALQAYIFTILATMYLAIAVNHAGEHHADAELTDDVSPETIGATAGSAHGRA